MRKHDSLRNLQAALVVVLLLGAGASLAVTVHTWVDADGVRHFADAPPSDRGAAASSEITIDGGAATVAEDVDYYSITNQWQRLRQERDAQTAAELERQRIEAAQGESPPPLREEPPHPAYYPNYYNLPPRFGPLYPDGEPERGPPSPRNAKVNTPPPVWPRER